MEIERMDEVKGDGMLAGQQCYVFCICEYFSPIEKRLANKPRDINEPFNQKQAHNPTHGYRYNKTEVFIERI